MSHVYITDNGCEIGVRGGRYIVRQYGEDVRVIPMETVESVSIFGNSHLTTRCIQTLLKSGVPVNFFSSRGNYFGRLESTSHNKVITMKKQFEKFSDESFVTCLSQKISMAKIHNQTVILRRYCRSAGFTEEKFKDEFRLIREMKDKAASGETRESIMGFEGIAARTYFSVLSQIIEPDFKFYGRNRRPPKDPFNALLSLGYTLLLYEIIAKLQAEGLTPYYGVLHKPKDGSPALASDMMEEWRAVMVDSMVLSMIQGHEIKIDDFEKDENWTGIYLTNDALKKFASKFERKINTQISYLSYSDEKFSFRNAMAIQCKKLVDSIETSDPQLYRPILLR